jgi:divalent metal cation (Fe/Co/Zn/Cd) transporter
METEKVILVIVIGLVSVLMLTYSFFTSREKGPILSNTYLLASKKERSTMNKSAEYHLVSNVFGILGLIFLLLTIEILTSWTWIYYILGMLIAVVIIYAIIESIKTEMKK